VLRRVAEPPYRLSHMPCHCSLTCRAGEWAPAMSMSLSRSRSALQCKRRARSISALRRAARLLRRPLRTCFLASGAGAGGTGVGGGNACCLGGGMCNERRGPRNHDCTRNDGEEAEEMRVAATPSKKFRRLEGDTAVTKLRNTVKKLRNSFEFLSRLRTVFIFICPCNALQVCNSFSRCMEALQASVIANRVTPS
jgi:hypothetical protein